MAAEKYLGSRGMALKLSKGCYPIVPKSIRQNVRFRLFVLRQAMHSVEMQQLLMKWCAESPLFWINTFVWSLDTRLSVSGTTEPFVTFECQDRAFLQILDSILPPIGHAPHDTVIEKSRDMGITWLCLLVFLYLWIFHKERLALFCMSWQEAFVDGGNKSIFGKVDFALEHLPSWMLPPYRRIKCLLENLETGTTWEGAATTGESGSGGRFTSMFFDEFPMVREAEMLFIKTADCSPARIFNGTPNGVDTQFFRLIELSKEEGSPIRKLRLHWTEHPWKAAGLYRYNAEMGEVEVFDKKYVFAPNYAFIKDGKVRSPWYDAECKRRGWNKRAIAQELDIDHEAAGDQFYDYVEIRRLISQYAEPPLHKGVLKDGKFIDRDGAHLRIWFRLRSGGDGRPPKGKYGIGCDVASGVEGRWSTPSCASVVNLETGEKMGELSDARLRPDEFAAVVKDLADWFWGAIVVWENNGPGATFRKALVKDLGYTNLYLRKRSEQTLMPELTAEPGWHPSGDNKRELHEDYRAALSAGEFLNHSESALAETLKFVYDGNTVVHPLETATNNPSGAKANHGDQVVADALANLLVRDDGTVKRKVKGGGQIVDPLSPPVGSMAWRDWMAGQDDGDDGWE